MLQLYDLNHSKLHGLKNYKDLKIERTLDGDEVLSFLYPKSDNKHDFIKEECYIRTKKNEYVIKEVNQSDDWTGFVAKINIEDIKGKAVSNFETIEQTCSNAVNLALVGTGWTIGSCDVTKRRTVRKANCSSYEILQEIRKVYLCNLKFDAINKKVYIYQSIGTDKGAYFSDSLNLRKLDIQSNSYDFITRLIPIGKDGLKIGAINNGKEYVENYQYSNKVITAYWEDNRYTVVENLKADAIAKLNELSKPFKSYSADIIDLARLNDKYKNVLDYDLGDTITLISKDKKVKEKQRIVKIIEYLDEPERNSCEIANKTLRFEDIQADNQDIIDAADSVITSDGMIDSNKVDFNPVRLEVATLIADKANIGELNAVIANIGELNATKANITELNAAFARIGTLEVGSATIIQLNAVSARINILEADTASINNLLAENINVINANILDLKVQKANIIDLTAAEAEISNLKSSKANITDLTATNASVTNLTSQVATINTIVNGNITSANMAAGAIKAGDAVIANGAIGSAQIISLDVAKINAGNISTNKFVVTSDSGNLKIQGNTLKVWDNIGKERISLGLNGSDYNLLVRGVDGTTVLFGTDGVTNAGITEGAVDDSKISDDANISGTKIEKESLIVQINGATTTLKANRIKLDVENQTLDVAFTSLKSTVTTTANTVSSQGTAISTIQGQISSKIWQTDITNAINYVETQITFINDNYSTLTQTVNVITTSVASLSTSIDTTNGNVTAVDNKVSTLTQTVNGLTSTVSSVQQNYLTKSDASTTYSTNTRVATLEQSVTGLSSTVSSVQTIANSKRRVFTTTPSTPYEAGDLWTQGTSGDLMRCKTARASGSYNVADWERASKYTDDTVANTVQGNLNTTNSNLSSLTTRVSTAESSITQLNSSINLKVNTSDFTSYQTTVTNSLNSKANQSSLDTTNSNISNLTTRVSNTESSISILQNQISLKVEQTDITTAINNVSIGGRNLIIVKDLTLNGYLTSAGNFYSDTSWVITDFIAVTPGEQIIAGNYKNLGNAPSTCFYDNSKGYVSGINNGNSVGQSTPETIKNDKRRLVTVPANCYYLRFSFMKTDINKIKLEKGNKNTDWSPAPEDIQGQIDSTTTKISVAESNITQLNNSISLKVDTSTYNSKMSSLDNSINSLSTRMSSAELKITDSAIINTVSSTISNAKNEAINSANANTANLLTNYSTKSEVTQTANSIVMKFSSSGGYNLLKNSAFANNDISGWWFWGQCSKWADMSYYTEVGDMYIRNSSTTSGGGLWQNGIPMKPNTKYTLSVAIRREPNVKGTSFSLEYCSDEACSNIVATQQITLTLDNNRNSYTFTTPNVSTIKYSKMGFRHEGTTSTSGGFLVRINKPCLCEGEISVWSPHPSELIDGNTEINGNGVIISNGAFTVKNKAGQVVLSGDSNGDLFVSSALTVGGNSNGNIQVKNSSGATIFSANKDGTIVKDGTMRITSGNITSTGGISYPEGTTNEARLHAFGSYLEQFEQSGSQQLLKIGRYYAHSWQLVGDNRGNASQDYYTSFADSTQLHLSYYNGAMQLQSRTRLTHNQITSRYVIASSDGDGKNFQIGNDCWLGDVNEYATVKLHACDDSGRGMIRFGNGARIGHNNSTAFEIHGNTLASGHMYINTGFNTFCNRYAGLTSNHSVYIGNERFRVDTTGGHARLYNSWIGNDDTGIFIDMSGTILLKTNNVNRHVFNNNGTKTGGTMEIEGTVYGMSPTDSPQTLIEYLEYDVIVDGTLTIPLDPIYKQMVSKYAVFSSNPDIKIIAKYKDCFVVEGLGTVDFVIKGQRRDAQEYFKIMGGFEHGSEEEVNI